METKEEDEAHASPNKKGKKSKRMRVFCVPNWIFIINIARTNTQAKHIINNKFLIVTVLLRLHFKSSNTHIHTAVAKKMFLSSFAMNRAKIKK